MKKLLLVAVFVSAFCAGCDYKIADGTNCTIIGNACKYDICSFESEGHKYITRYHGGIIHAASCPCKKGGKE